MQETRTNRKVRGVTRLSLFPCLSLRSHSSMEWNGMEWMTIFSVFGQRFYEVLCGMNGKKKCDHLQHNLLCISWEARFVNRLSETFIFQHSQFHESSINNHGNDKIIKL